jgi:hypothetical protein
VTVGHAQKALRRGFSDEEVASWYRFAEGLKSAVVVKE